MIAVLVVWAVVGRREPVTRLASGKSHQTKMAVCVAVIGKEVSF